MVGGWALPAGPVVGVDAGETAGGGNDADPPHPPTSIASTATPMIRLPETTRRFPWPPPKT
jgi:hypothetical protein